MVLFRTLEVVLEGLLCLISYSSFTLQRLFFEVFCALFHVLYPHCRDCPSRFHLSAHHHVLVRSTPVPPVSTVPRAGQIYGRSTCQLITTCWSDQVRSTCQHITTCWPDRKLVMKEAAFPLERRPEFPKRKTPTWEKKYTSHKKKRAQT